MYMYNMSVIAMMSYDWRPVIMSTSELLDES